MQGAEQAAQRLYGVAASVRIVALPAEVKRIEGPAGRISRSQHTLAQAERAQLVRGKKAMRQAREWQPQQNPEASGSGKVAQEREPRRRKRSGHRVETGGGWRAGDDRRPNGSRSH